MNQAYIIFVPGKNPKPPANQHRSLLWRALLEGVRRAEPEVFRDLIQYVEHFKLIAWNYLYYQESKDANRELPWIDALINQHGPTKQDIKEANGWHRKLNTFLYNTIDHVPPLLHVLPAELRTTAQELERYFKDENNIASRVRALLEKEIRALLENGEKVLLIGHSMGSVIAYDTLWSLSNQKHLAGKVDLLTIGSPLGMNYVQHRLMGSQYQAYEKYPANIRHWINVSSVGDVTALDRTFADDFSDMLAWGLVDFIEDHCCGIYNFYRNEEGLNCHRSYGYLVNPAVGKVIADWWRASV